MKKIAIVFIIGIAVTLSGCGKNNISTISESIAGNWAEYTLPEGCKAKQIAADKGLAVLCEDGRVFH